MRHGVLSCSRGSQPVLQHSLVYELFHIYFSLKCGGMDLKTQRTYKILKEQLISSNSCEYSCTSEGGGEEISSLSYYIIVYMSFRSSATFFELLE